MTILTHAAFGGLVGQQFSGGHLWLAAFLGFFSHFPLDLIPHNDYLYYYFRPQKNPYTSFVSRVIFSLTVLLLLVAFNLSGEKGLASTIAAASAVLPDVLTGLLPTFKINFGFFNRLHHLLHHRLTLAEGGYNLWNRQNPVSRKTKLAETFALIKSSPVARLGWFLETGAEFLFFLICLRFLFS